MPLSIPPALKKIAPYIKRAEELDQDTSTAESRLVAYYCRQYAVHLGIPLSNTAPETKACLGELLGELEREKPAMDNFTRDEAAFLCRAFAENVFAKADGEDRNGAASKGTAKTFYAAASFLQMLEQFTDGSTEADAEQTEKDKKKVVYAKWKATEIVKAIKEGRTPTPGGFGQDDEGGELDAEEDARSSECGGIIVEDASVDDDMGLPPAPKSNPQNDDSVEVNGFDLPAPPAAYNGVNGSSQSSFSEIPKPLPPPKPMMPPTSFEPETIESGSDEGDQEGTEVELGPPPAYPPTTASSIDRPALSYQPPEPEPPSPSKSKSSKLFGGFGKKKSNGFGFGSGGEGKPSKAQLADAVELTRFALAALEDKDAALGAERLQQALAALGQ